MKSPARRHFLKHQAAALAAAAAPGEQIQGNAYELMLAQLTEDRRKLHAIQSVEGKAKLKRELLPAYAPWIQGVLDGGNGGQDDVLMTVMVWCLDVGFFDAALDIAAYALQHGLAMPDQYNRTTATVVAEELAEQALKAIQAGEPVRVQDLLRTADLVADADMPDQVRAKLHKAIGYALRLAEDLESRQAAMEHLQRALQLHDKVGVKKDIEILEREIKAAQQELQKQQETAANQQGQQGTADNGTQQGAGSADTSNPQPPAQGAAETNQGTAP